MIFPPPQTRHNPILFTVHADDPSNTRHLGFLHSSNHLHTNIKTHPFPLVTSWSYSTFVLLCVSLYSSSCYPHLSNYTCLFNRIGLKSYFLTPRIRLSSGFCFLLLVLVQSFNLFFFFLIPQLLLLHFPSAILNQMWTNPAFFAPKTTLSHSLNFVHWSH